MLVLKRVVHADSIHRACRVGLIVAFGLGKSPFCFGQGGIDHPTHQQIERADKGSAGTTFIPLDSWMYEAAERLYATGYLPTAYWGLRPWTRASLAHMLRLSGPAFSRRMEDDEEGAELYGKLTRELAEEMRDEDSPNVRWDSAYFRLRQAQGSVLNDSFHVGQTFINDYGRPYQRGSNVLAGYSASSRLWRTAVSVRGEYQHAPAGQEYSQSVANFFDSQDGLVPPSFTTPRGTLSELNQFRIVEAEASVMVRNHQIAFGKLPAWLGPAYGASFALSDNADSIYSFQINRVDPLYIPGVSRVAGMFRYSFQVGSLKHHDSPNDPWIHTEKISFKPHPDLEFGFTRSVVWGGKNHVPITFGTFIRSFVSLAGVQPDVKMSRNDPGARFSMFDAQWRIPFQDYLFSLYVDSLVHDDVSPVSAPGRAAFRPGLLMTRLPAMPRWDLRAEAVYTDVPDVNSNAGVFLMTEFIQKQAYTNNGNIMSDWIGRESKGGQAWLTWHHRPDEWVQLDYRMAKAAKDFIPQGTTQQNLGVNAVWRPTRTLETRGSVHAELWRAPFIATGKQTNVGITFQLTYFPHGDR